MKRILLSMLLVITLISSSMCCVNAASLADQWNGFFVNGRTVGVEVDVKVNGADRVYDYAGTPIEFTASLDMTEVKAAVTALSLNLDAAEKQKKATGSIVIEAEWTGVDAPAAGTLEVNNLAGFSFENGVGADFFEEPVNRVLAGNKLTATINVKDNVTLESLANLPDTIVLTQSGFTLASNGEITGELTLDIKVENDANYTVPFRVNVNGVTVGVKGSGGSGSAATSTFNKLKYETNGGAAIADESYVGGKTVQLTKVPEKEGYIFDGWYADAALTQKITSVKMDADVTVYAAWKAVESEEPVVAPHPVPEMLNGEDHYAYLSGYPDGTIRPDSNITRAEVATIFFRLLKDEVREQYLSKENVFDDVNEGDWFNTAVSTMAKAGIVNGRYADTFAPDEYITRAEFTTICARFDDANEAGENTFTDVSDHWAEDYILEAVAYNWIDGYEDFSFRPEKNITRAEAATLINRVLNRVPENADAMLDTMKVWPDNASSAWYYIAVQEATNTHTYERVNEVNEKWLELTENRDWTVYEK